MQTRPCPTCAESWGFAFHLCPYDRTPLPPLQPSTPVRAQAPAPRAQPVRPALVRHANDTERELRALFAAANELRHAS